MRGFFLLLLLCQWNERLIREVCDEASAEAILHLPPPLNTEFDSPCWLLSQDNSFSIKNAYLEILKSQTSLFAILSPDRIKHFLWRVVWDALPTYLVLARVGFNLVCQKPSCP